MARELKLGRRDAVTTTVNTRLAMEQLRLDTPYKALVGLRRRPQDQPEKGSVSFWRAVLGGRGKGEWKRRYNLLEKCGNVLALES